MGDAGQAIDIERIVEMTFDMVEYPFETGDIGFSAGVTHLVLGSRDVLCKNRQAKS